MSSSILTFQVVSIFPELVSSLHLDGVIAQALKKNLINLEIRNPRDFTKDTHRTVDDRPYGGGDGMVLLAEPLEKALLSFQELGHVIALSPKGKVLTDKRVQELAKINKITLICGRYSGIDQRLLAKYVTEEVSLGDFVLSGGELPAMMLIDAVSRFIPGVLGHADSPLLDSITMGGLEAPLYTRPRDWQGAIVPEILTTGHHEKMEQWKQAVSALLTWTHRPDLSQCHLLSEKERKIIRDIVTRLTESDKSQIGLAPDKVTAFLDFI